MLKRILFTFILLSVIFVQCSDSITDPKEIRELNEIEKKVVSSSDEFGFNIFKKLNETESDKNIFISPLSISMALGMTLNGAANNTLDEMKSILQFNSLTQKEVNESYKSLIELLTQVDPKVIIEIANSIWYKQGKKFENNFIETNKKYFDAKVEGLDFSNDNSVNIINNWVNDNTNGKIDKIIDNIPQSAIMYLINAIYFKGTWKYEFDNKNTRDATFTTSTGEEVVCKMMSLTSKLKYYTNENYQTVELPYGDGSFSMIIILPNANKNINETMNILNSAEIKNIQNNFKELEGSVELPRFKLNYEKELSKLLSSLGMIDAFTGSADFTNMYEPGGIFISRVIHKSFVQVDEEGTEAAAVTAVEIKYTSASNGFYIRMDKPFVFLIRENTTGSVLFMGKIENPEFF